MVGALFLLTSLLLHLTSASIYHVTATDDKRYHPTKDNFHTLEYYINNTDKYLTSHTYLYFLSGQHQLNTDLVINSVTNLTLVGNHSSNIMCISAAYIEVVNVTNFTLMNINLFNCGKSSHYLYSKYSTIYSQNNLILTEALEIVKSNASILLDHCTSVEISNVNISVKAGSVGLLAINMMNSSLINDLRVDINCSTCPNIYSQISGVIFIYNSIFYNDNLMYDAVINLSNYQYKTHGSCPYHLQYAIKLLLFQKHHNISINIQNIIFNNLENSSLLYYSGETSELDIESRVTIKNLLICNNVGNTQLKVFHIVLYNYREMIKDLSFLHYDQRRNMIELEDCTFANNTNVASMVYVTPASSRVIGIYIKMTRIIFHNNNQVHFIEVRSTAEMIWQLTTFIELINVKVCSNKHTDGDSLISVINGVISIHGTVLFINNSYYVNIFKLHLSVAVLRGYLQLTKNHARQIINAKTGSYFILATYATVSLSENTVYMVVKQSQTFGDNFRPICPIQFYSFKGNLDSAKRMSFLYKIVISSNVIMMSKELLGKDMSFENCTWLAGTAFRSRTAEYVYQRVFRIANIPVNMTAKRLIPLSICTCINQTNYDCYSANLRSIFPGQTIAIKLLVEKKWLTQYIPSTTLMVANTLDDDCSVVDSHQLLQTHFNLGCNTYRYTIRPLHEGIKECKLFLGIKDMPEMFFIEIKPCPLGFILDKDRKVCRCDPLLDNEILSITSCDLDDETILRPANSWISADTVNNLHTFLVSSACPFDYCLPYSSHHKLSDPDSQCQYNRSSMLCGQCKQGLSRVLGSPECRRCSNIYLLLIIPIIIFGIALVVILFVFHKLTITNGTINTFIFFFNVIYINYTTFFPGCQSIICTTVMFINLDFSIKTCFYNGMDDYALTWLLLAFPTYLIIIATFLIVMSRYSTTIQRVTAKKALPVLGTIFLLSYTKVLRLVCRVLFRYLTLTHLPSNHTVVLWLISTNTPLFGVKFFLLFIVCLILFLILLPFNIILLFTRTLSRFKFITSFKPLLDVYFAPYKDKAFYWTGLLLLTRTIIFVLSAFDVHVSFMATGISLGGLLWWHGVVKPFNNEFENIQESLLILALMVIHIVQLYKINDSSLKVAQVIIAGTVGYFALVIIFYCCIFRFKSAIQIYMRKFYDKICRMMGQRSIDKRSIEMEVFRNNIADVTYNYHEFQEPLIEYDR